MSTESADPPSRDTAAAPLVLSCSDLEKTATHADYAGRAQSLSPTPTVRGRISRDLEHETTKISTDDHGNTYPERGRDAYLCVFGSFCGCMLSLGFMNTLATYQAYLRKNQLSQLPDSTIGWIFGLYAFLSFFLGLQIGPLFDAYGPRYIVLAGTILMELTYVLLAQCSTLWQFLLVFSVLGGTGTSLVFTPSIAAVGHWFFARRGNFTGIACVGGSLGGIVWPLALQALFLNRNVGWAWSQRILALINLPLAISANVFIKARLPSKRPITKADILPDMGIFKDATFTLITLAVFFLEWALFVPVSYLTSYTISIGVSEQLAYQLIAVFNAGSCFGRWLPGLVADRIGRFNTLILTTVLCWTSAFMFWLPGSLVPADTSRATQLALVITFDVLFGFGSGAGISLVPVCVGQLCKTEHYGRYYATCYTVVSFATLTGIPIAGALVPAAGNTYWGLIVFTGLGYAVSTVIMLIAKGGVVGWTGREIFRSVF